VLSFLLIQNQKHICLKNSELMKGWKSVTYYLNGQLTLTGRNFTLITVENCQHPVMFRMCFFFSGEYKQTSILQPLNCDIMAWLDIVIFSSQGEKSSDKVTHL